MPKRPTTWGSLELRYFGLSLFMFVTFFALHFLQFWQDEKPQNPNLFQFLRFDISSFISFDFWCSFITNSKIRLFWISVEVLCSFAKFWWALSCHCWKPLSWVIPATLTNDSFDLQSWFGKQCLVIPLCWLFWFLLRLPCFGIAAPFKASFLELSKAAF